MKKVNIILFLITIALAVGKMSYCADVLDIGTGARSIGLGRSYIGISGSSDNIFGNPAGLRELKKVELTSLYTDLSGDVRYTLFGLGIPKVFKGTFAVGYAGNKIGDIYATTIDATGRPTTLEPFTYGTDMLLGVYSGDINKNLQYGIRVKYLKKGGSIASVGEGSGANVDLGLLYTINEDSKVGIVLENALLGGLGRIKWNNGVEEEMPYVATIGGKYSFRKNNLDLYGDISFRSSRGFEIRLGTEWNPWRQLSLRGGIEQLSASPSEKYLNYSLGLGYKLDNLKIDYAYYLDTLLTYNSRHYVSLAVSLPEGKGKWIDEGIIVDRGDRSIVTTESIVLVGRTGRQIVKVSWEGKLVDVLEGEYSIRVNLKIGKNKIILVGLDSMGNQIAKYEARVLRTSWYRDLIRYGWVRNQIEYMTTMGIQGFTLREATSGFIRPAESVSRMEMAAILARAKGIPAKRLRQPVAKDISTLHWGASYIKEALDNNWLTLFNDGTFKSDRKISRAEAIAIVMRFAGISPQDEGNTSGFTDVPIGYWATGYINAAKKAGYLDYVKGDKLVPGGQLTRAEIFYLLSKTDYIKDKINWLLDFDKGY